MRLVFIHGWGFGPHFWEPLGAALSDFSQIRVDFGFFSDRVEIPAFHEDDILIGHSLGFAWGMARSRPWRGWVSINGFACFVDNAGRKACAAPAALRAMRQGLARHTEETLRNFYKSIGAEGNAEGANAEHLTAGLSMLQTADITGSLRESAARGLALASRDDPLVPVPATEFLASQTRNASLLWHDQGGHLLPLRQPEWCAEAIRKLLA